MNNKIYLFLASITILLLVGTVSAALCKNSNGFYSECGSTPFNHRYQGDPDKSGASNFLKTHTISTTSSTSSRTSNRYNIADTASKPIFKGSYGNSRYQLYASGDNRPSIFFNNYGYGGYGYGGYSYPYFSGGYGYSGYDRYSYSRYSYPYFGNSYSYIGYSYPYYSGGYGNYYGLGYNSYYSSYYNPYYSLFPFF